MFVSLFFCLNENEAGEPLQGAVCETGPSSHRLGSFLQRRDRCLRVGCAWSLPPCHPLCPSRRRAGRGQLLRHELSCLAGTSRSGGQRALCSLLSRQPRPSEPPTGGARAILSRASLPRTQGFSSSPGCAPSFRTPGEGRAMTSCHRNMKNGP